MSEVTEKRKRFEHVDFLRAVAIIGVIVTHVLSYHLSDKTIYFIWNYLHFVVGMFVFCSAYVLSAHYQNKLQTIGDTLRWYKKRIIRLLVPLYIFICTYYALWFTFPNFFNGRGLVKSTNFVLQSFLLTGGVDTNWLPLLFIQLTLLFPILIMLMRKKWGYTYVFFALFVTLWFTIVPFPHEHFRLVMWIPWSLILWCGIYAQQYEERKINDAEDKSLYLKTFFGGAIIFSTLFILWSMKHSSFVLFNHKYPPDFYYLSYTFMLTSLFLLISRAQFVHDHKIKKWIHFVSSVSYQLFFIHFLILDFILKSGTKIEILSHVVVQLLLVIGGSLFVAYIISKRKISSIYTEVKLALGRIVGQIN